MLKSTDLQMNPLSALVSELILYLKLTERQSEGGTDGLMD